MDIREKVLATAIKQLEALGCLYHILDFNGEEHGFALAKPTVQDPAATVKSKKHDRDRGRERSKAITPYLMQVTVGGDPVDIPVPAGFTLDEMQSSIGSRLGRALNVGTGEFVTARNRDGNAVQVLLMANNTNMGVAEAVVKSFANGPLAAFAEEVYEHHKAVLAETRKKSA